MQLITIFQLLYWTGSALTDYFWSLSEKEDSTEVYSETRQTPKIEHFAKIVNGF